MTLKFNSFLFVLLLFNITLYSQENTFINLDSINQLIKRDSIRKDSLKKQIMLEKWDNKVFNPYTNHLLELPFNLVFEDTLYSSPILKNNVITSRYGWRWGRAHKGIDVDLITGDEVLAILDGKVRFVGYHSGHGKAVIIRHYNGLETVYAHLSKYEVTANQVVKKGQVIGKGGRTGNARGSHVHIETKYKGHFINPEYLFSFNEDNKIHQTSFWITRDWVSPFMHNSKRPTQTVYYNSKDEAIESEGIKQKVYIVKRGDTLYHISRKYNVPISKICKANSIRKNSTLKVGQELVLGY